ncbi:hypothetical protein GGTG_13393 [Gaeumannomyces tritici R3-111a-1]|uniref:Uncharacterized protein n=1 Tax=Gaeumannomyces tritici (strain R3-111a-1) TaxID=644352 RepID=J3PIR4_GAET3|nr:hypothetical protein GGTG_13393 [Gaeumannomyces tritici R3-111a-1]EJT68996.1 hypothetical protein GGTG_13393 [Gaeumannomyces tritici R3-111a-1]
MHSINEVQILCAGLFQNGFPDIGLKSHESSASRGAGSRPCAGKSFVQKTGLLRALVGALKKPVAARKAVPKGRPRDAKVAGGVGDWDLILYSGNGLLDLLFGIRFLPHLAVRLQQKLLGIRLMICCCTKKEKSVSPQGLGVYWLNTVTLRVCTLLLIIKRFFLIKKLLFP